MEGYNFFYFFYQRGERPSITDTLYFLTVSSSSTPKITLIGS